MDNEIFHHRAPLAGGDLNGTGKNSVQLPEEIYTAMTDWPMLCQYAPVLMPHRLCYLSK